MKKLKDAFGQVGLAWFLTCIVAVVLLLLNKGNPDGAAITLVDILSEQSILSVWLKLLQSYTIGRSNPDAVVTLTVIAYAGAFVDSLFVGVVVHIVNSLKERKTVDILSTYIGAIIGVVLIHLIKTSGEVPSVLIEVGCIALALVGIKMILTRKFPNIFDKKKLWTILVDSIYGVMMCGYITKLVMVSSGNFSSLAVAIVEVVIFSIIVALLGYLAYLLTGKKKI